MPRNETRTGAAIPMIAASVATLLLFSTSGCVTTGLDDPRLATAVSSDIPENWTAARIEVPGDAATAWMEDFGDSALMDLAREAVGTNYNLVSTAARIRQAEERVRIANADRRPLFDTDFTTSRSQNLRGAQFVSSRANQFALGLDLIWEVDLWGRVANLKRARLAELDAADSDFQAARLSLAANVAKTALEQVESELQVELSRKNLESLRENLEILDAKLEAGDAEDRTALDISLSRADVARAESTIAQQQREADASRRVLEALLGRYPKGKIKSIKELPAIHRSVPAGLPTTLLLRRPDLIAAEARVDAQLQEVAAARKALLPTFRINGGIGTSTTQELKDLLNLSNLVWNIGQGLAQPVYQGGRLRSEIRLSEAERDEIAATYAETALTAFREVETALAAEQYYLRQLAALEKAVEESDRAERLSLDQYEKGIPGVDIITVLESQRRAFDARSTLLQLRLQRLQNRIDLHLSLGGDFDHPPEVREGN
ncbi:MAG: efflux transporter outer membrane subunit [Verrucomicrobiales bacterium]|nr:efflux transporter outer membrane subunit [Verrucomicrobiales bacterium]